MIRLVIPGEPRGKGRPRFNRATGRTYTPRETVIAEQEIRQAWQQAGRPYIAGPLTVEVVALFARPASHRKQNGELGAVGLRSPWPTKPPDFDNVQKLCTDALNALAFQDDAYVVLARVEKRWAGPGEEPGTTILIAPMHVPVAVAA